MKEAITDGHHEMPPWLRVKDNIVLTWEGKHHVEPIKGGDPFEVARRLHERLRSVMHAQYAAKADAAAPVAANPGSESSNPARKKADLIG